MSIRKFLTALVAWAAALAIMLIRWTCRVRLHNDPRPGLRDAGTPYIYAVLHAHQIPAIVDGERGTGAMVSRSLDGELIVPTLKLCGIVPFRGSGGRGQRRGRGGLVALEALVEHVRSGHPAYLAVDGPRGPRGRVQRGIATLARRTNAVIICLVPVPSRRWILHKAWDRMQIPKPFARIDGYFAPPIRLDEQKSNEEVRRGVEAMLQRLEREFDPEEASYLLPSHELVGDP